MTRKKAGAGGFFCLHRKFDGTTSPEKSILKIAKFCYVLLTNPSRKVPDNFQYTLTRNQNANPEAFQRLPAAGFQSGHAALAFHFVTPPARASNLPAGRR